MENIVLPTKQTHFFIKGVNDLNEFMKNGRKYLEKELGIKLFLNFCTSQQKKCYKDIQVDTNELLFKIDFANADGVNHKGEFFLNVLNSGAYGIDELIGLAVTNKLNEINQIH
tara:strand:- start:7095 stop:7433 length:339 start_codon:yes stop_codon:yes gene_type:complete